MVKTTQKMLILPYEDYLKRCWCFSNEMSIFYAFERKRKITKIEKQSTIVITVPSQLAYTLCAGNACIMLPYSLVNRSCKVQTVEILFQPKEYLGAKKWNITACFGSSPFPPQTVLYLSFIYMHGEVFLLIKITS